MNFKKVPRYISIFAHWRFFGSKILPYMPEHISIEVTNACNFRCAFCAQSDPGHHQKVPIGYLSVSALRTILKKLRDGGVRGNTLNWTLDGEPFLNKSFPDLCSEAIEHDFTCFVFATNFSVSKLSTLEKLPVRSGVNYVCAVDYCASESLFEEIRGVKGSWRTIKDNIFALDRSGMRHIKIGITDISSFRYHNDADMEARRLDLAKMFAGLECVKILGHRDYHNQAGFLHTQAKTSSYNRCLYPWTHLVIAHNGDVVPCCRDIRKLSVLGNLLTQDVQEIWNGNAMSIFRENIVAQRVKENAACCDCDLPWGKSKFNFSFLYDAAVKRMWETFR